MAEQFYESGSLYKQKSGKYVQLVGDEWRPYTGITPEQQQSAKQFATDTAKPETFQQPSALSEYPDAPVETFTTNTRGLLGAMGQGLQEGLGGETLGWLPQGNQQRANRQAIREEFPLATGIGKAAPSTAAAVLTGGSSLPIQAAGQAATGYLADDLTGAAMGLGIVGLGAMATRQIQFAKNSPYADVAPTVRAEVSPMDILKGRIPFPEFSGKVVDSLKEGVRNVAGGIYDKLGGVNPKAGILPFEPIPAMPGEGAMSVRMKQVANAQEAAKTSRVGVLMGEDALGAGTSGSVAPGGIPVSPNAGKFGQGGGIGGFTSGGFNYKTGVQYDVNETLQQAAKMGLISDPATTAGGTFKTELKNLTRDLLKAHPAPIQGTQNRFGQWLSHQQQQGLTNSQILSKINSVRSSVTDAPSVSTKGIYDIHNPIAKTNY